jgi:hypothetical protein
MSSPWLISGCALVIVAVMVGRWLLSRGPEPDLGAVSEQWLSELRLSQNAEDHR